MMKEDLLLFDNEMQELKDTGWDYEILFEDKKQGIYSVRADIPESILQEVNQ
jgi:hypothetical protein